MTISGSQIDLNDLKPIELLPASKAQEYIQKLESMLEKEDGRPLYLLHDGETGTSDIFIGDAWNALQEFNSIKDTTLFVLINRLIENKNSFRIWYAGNDPVDYSNVDDCESLEDVMRITSETKAIQIRYLANKPFQRTR